MQEILVFSEEKKQKIFFDETRIKIVDVIKGEKVNISMRRWQSLYISLFTRAFSRPAQPWDIVKLKVAASPIQVVLQ